MRTAFFVLAIASALSGCSSADHVEILHPLGGTPDKPSTVNAVVTGLDVNLGMLRVRTRAVDGTKRTVNEAVWIDGNTLFSNSGGGRNLRSWEDINGAEVVIRGWYRHDDYYADEIDVISFPPSPPTPRRL